MQREIALLPEDVREDRTEAAAPDASRPRLHLVVGCEIGDPTRTGHDPIEKIAEKAGRATLHAGGTTPAAHHTEIHRSGEILEKRLWLRREKLGRAIILVLFIRVQNRAQTLNEF